MTPVSGASVEVTQPASEEKKHPRESNDDTNSNSGEECSLSKKAKSEDMLEGHARMALSHFKSLGSPRYAVAPMVDHSELAFRMMCRKYGAELCYTPMFHAQIFCQSERYRKEKWTTCAEDRPLVVQFCANDKNVFLEAAKKVEPYCDAIDLNLGCPQHIAKRGNYGSFLMDDLPLVYDMVSFVSSRLSIPLWVKIRRFPELADTIAYAKGLEAAGAAVIAVHGRTRAQKGHNQGLADWSVIKAVREAVRVPVYANGNVRHLDDVKECMKETGVVGVLSAESLLANPRLFSGFRVQSLQDSLDLSKEFISFCQQYGTPDNHVKSHLFKLLKPVLAEFTDMRVDLGNSNRDMDGHLAFVDKLQALLDAKLNSSNSAV